ncbi:hypothetical protein [Mesorhizobium marinum]|uniref:Uncharacterized protein n=1 Tax=Mesorhizobium marinum TaxID=3228790 RepID=A0ABV3R3E3_9HYPH
MDDLAAVISRFPEHEFLVRRLHASNAEFRTLCEDHALAASAVGRWKNDRSRSEHYRLLVDELESEVLEFIEGRHPHQVGKRPGH